MTTITWNMQGATTQGENIWTAEVASLFKVSVHGANRANIAALQECGAAPGSATNINNLNQIPLISPAGMQAQLNLYYWSGISQQDFYILHWLNVSTQHSMAIVWDTANGFMGQIQGGELINVPGGRPVLCLTTANGNNMTRYCSIHANSVLGGGVANGAAILTAIPNQNNTTDLVLGDWNTEPGGWGGNGTAPLPAGWNITGAGGITQRSINNQAGGYEIDYLISRNLAGLAGVQAQRIAFAPGQYFNLVSDHCPVRYNV